ncbi:MAG: hypothetical protein II040_05310 [Muribaculaceae bacterium]|nr:hypothetical protein [Muribaculaceae bacterium]
MNSRRLLISLVAIALTASGLWARDDEVVVTRQFTLGQRNSLPENTIVVETKRLSINKKADARLVDAIVQVMDTIAQEDYQNRTFVLLLEPREGGEIAIAAHSDDIVTHGKQDPTVYYGTMEHNRYHFVMLKSIGNEPLLEQIFKRQSKVKFVQEFEFVDYKTTIYPTNVIARWSPDKGLCWQTVTINEDPSADRPATLQTNHQ